MVQTGVVINKESWLVLQEEPLYSARFIDREGSDELAIVMRVEELEWFVGAQPPLTLELTTWCSAHGVWVVIVTYDLRPTFGEAQGGRFFLNPRQAADATILRKFLRQETLAAIFLSEDCTAHYTVGVMLAGQDLRRWQQFIEDMNRTLDGDKLSDDLDGDFLVALQELQSEETAL
jgi:hypothetical protein